MLSESELLYFFSAIAQTAGAILGIGIVVLTFHAQWIESTRKSIMEKIGNICDTAGKLRGHPYPWDCHNITDTRLLKTANDEIQKLSNEIEFKGQDKSYFEILNSHKENLIILIGKYNEIKPLIETQYFYFGLISLSLCILLSLPLIGLVSELKNICLSGIAFSICLILFLIGLASFFILACKAVTYIKIATSEETL